MSGINRVSGIFDERHHMGRTRYPKGLKPSNNRYLPHQGQREIERRRKRRAKQRKQP